MIVSGGTKGIGSAVAQAVGREVMNLVIADIPHDTLAIAEASLSQQSFLVLALTADDRSEADWNTIAEPVVARFRVIHVLMNNAGLVGAVPAVSSKTIRWKTGAGRSTSISWGWSLE